MSRPEVHEPAKGLRVVMMAGGTGGHVFPALAVADGLRERGADVTWLGVATGMEAELVPKHGFEMAWIRVAGLRGKGALSWLTAPFRVLRALGDALGVMRRIRPNLVVGMGGFVAGPGGLAAWLLRRPLVIHEQNAIAGLTNRLLSRLARRVLQAFPDTFNNGETVGNPVRAEIAAIAPPDQRLAERTGPVRLLVVGGSLGAMALNRLLPAALARLGAAQRPEIWHQAGRTLETAQAAYADTDLQPNLVAFIDDMAEAYAWADLVVCRAGALTVAELAAVGLPSVLVPFPYAVDDHQTVNAAYLVDADAALLVQERDLDAESLAALLAPLLSDRARLRGMAQRARDKGWRESRQQIVDICMAVAA